MGNNLKFNSSVCTTREQSQRLLDLGLKPETADMHHYKWSEGYWEIESCPPRGSGSSFIPAWSLHRLIEILPSDIKPRNDYYNIIFDKDIVQYENYGYGIEVLKSFGDSTNIYDNIIDCIKWLISNGYFNKEYLKQ